MFLLSVLAGVANAGSIINCNQIFSSTYAGPIATFLYGAGGNNFSGIADICILLVMLDFSIVSVIYAIGTGFNLNNLVNFSKTELVEGVFNLIILVAVGGTALAVYGAVVFFANVGQAGLTTYGTVAYVAPPATAQGMFVNLCTGIDSNIMWLGFTNWAWLVVNLFSANIYSSINVLVIPNSWGYAYQPFGGYSLLVQLLWDDQAAYFGAMFFGMFLVALLFVIYYLFPIFLFTGLALRSFPWTRAAGGSFIALFVAFYIIFPALMYPFVTGTSGEILCSTGHITLLCEGAMGSFHSTALSSLVSGFNENFGDQYYLDVTGFAGGWFGIGLAMFGLVIALLISYEIVEKLGSILGAPSISAQRALSRIL